MSAMISNRLLLGPLALAQELGLDETLPLAGLGIETQALEERDTLVPKACIRGLFNRLHEINDEPSIALRCIDMVPVGFFAPLLQPSPRFRPDARTPSIADALASWVDLVPKLDTEARAHLTSLSCAARVAHDRRAMIGAEDSGLDDPLDRYLDEFGIAILVRELSHLVVRDIQPIQIEFRHSRPDNPLQYEKYFGCPVYFESAQNAIVLRPEELHSPILIAQTYTSPKPFEVNGDTDTQGSTADEFIDRVDCAIRRVLDGRRITIQLLALELKMSPRTLQRRLFEHGISYRERLESARRCLSLSYLRTPGIGIAETAFSLGYTDVTSFHRVFQSWAGATPGRYRNRRIEVRSDRIVRGIQAIGRAKESEAGE